MGGAVVGVGWGCVRACVCVCVWGGGGVGHSPDTFQSIHNC